MLCVQCGRPFTGRGRARFCSPACKTRHDVNQRRDWRRVVATVKASGITLADAQAHRSEAPAYPRYADVASDLTDARGRVALVPDDWDRETYNDHGTWAAMDYEHGYERSDPTQPHALWAGNASQHHEDQAWREDIPKATAGGTALDDIPHAQWMQIQKAEAAAAIAA